MNDEIKEILSYLKKKENTRRIKCITIEESKQLLDYITNLQQENERLKELVNADNESYDIQETIINRQKSELLEQEDYKSRCEKAIEYLKNNCYIGNCVITYEAIDITNVMNILNGRSDE